MNRIALAFAAALLLGGCHRKADKAAEPGPAASRPTLEIAATGNVWGQVEPCG